MIYLKYFKFPSTLEIDKYIAHVNYTLYPWNIFFHNLFTEMSFTDLTILYGNNGTGKTTVLNIVASKLKAKFFNELTDDSFYDEKSNLYHPFCDFVKKCEYSFSYNDNGNLRKSKNIILITSNDIFKIIRERDEFNNQRVKEYEFYKAKRREILARGNPFKTSADYEALKEYLEIKKITQNKYLERNVRPKKTVLSNGQEVLSIYDDLIEGDSIYLLDEPENCLSSKYQLELVELIKKGSRYYGCQFIISTHSPLILGMDKTRVYNLDESPVNISNWYELENVKVYYEFFRKNKDKFK